MSTQMNSNAVPVWKVAVLIRGSGAPAIQKYDYFEVAAETRDEAEEKVKQRFENPIESQKTEQVGTIKAST